MICKPQNRRWNRNAAKKKRTEKRCRQSSQQAQQCKTIAGEVQKRYRSWESEARQGNTLEKLYQMMTGTLKKGERISFERYVQTYYFNRVLQFANQKLYQLSNGEIPVPAAAGRNGAQTFLRG